MKKTITILLITALLSTCGSSDQNKAISTAKEVQSALNAIRPGTIATTEGGWTMKAKLNGKDWSAASIMSPDEAGRIVGYNDDENIGLPYNRKNMVVGYKSIFGEHNAVDIVTNDEVGLWAGRKGEMEITKVDENWAEGIFFVTGSANGTDKTMEITDGFFRISMKKIQ